MHPAAVGVAVAVMPDVWVMVAVVMVVQPFPLVIVSEYAPAIRLLMVNGSLVIPLPLPVVLPDVQL